MWIISSALSEWHSAIFSTVPERESRPQRQFSTCSRFVNHEWITAQTRITSSQFSEWVAAVPLPAGMLAAELNWTEKGTNQSMKWSRSFRSTRSWPTQHYCTHRHAAPLLHKVHQVPILIKREKVLFLKAGYHGSFLVSVYRTTRHSRDPHG